MAGALVAFGLGLSGIASPPPPAPPPKPFGAACLDAAQGRMEKERDLARLAQGENRKTLEASRALEEKARAAESPAAVAMAQRAVSTAEEALKKNLLREARATQALGWLARLRQEGKPSRPVAGFLPRAEGSVEIQPAGGGSARRLSGEEPPVAGPGDTVRTGADGRAEIILPAGDLLSLDAGTAVMLLDEGAEVLAGVVKARIAKRFAAKFEVRTPSAVTSVRGTDFLVRELPGKPASVVVLEGTVAFGDRAGRKTVLVEAGQQSYLLPDGTPAEPSKANLSEMRRWWDE